MLRILYSDLRSLLKHISLKLCIGASMIYALAFVVILKVIMYFVADGSFIYGEDIVSAYNDIAIFVITAFAVMFFTSDFANGTIRNKLVSGLRKSEIFISSVLSGMFASVLISVAVILFETLLTLIFSEGFMTYNLAELSDNFLMHMITAASIGAFASMITLIFAQTRFAYFAGFVIVFFINLFNSEVAQDLYPMNGNCVLTGTKLALYTAYDRFSPFIHFDAYPRWDILSYLAGSVVLTAISIGIGLIIFNRKEIK